MRQDKTKLYAGVAAAVALAAAGGFGLAKLTAGTPAAAPEAEEEHAEGPEGVVAMTPQQATAAGIAVQAVAATGFANEIVAQATVAAAPNGEAVLTARAAGAVTRINKRIGDAVSAGEAVAIVESREAAQLAAERTSAAAQADLAQKQLARERRLFEQRVSARQDYEQAQAQAVAANAESRRAQVAAGAARITSDGRGVVVTSPISGRITAAPVALGSFVQPETELFRIADPQRIQIEAAVSGVDAARVAVGDRVIVEAPDGASVEGRVRSITPALNRETGAATAVLEVPNVRLQPGQLVRARIVTSAPTGRSAMVVSDEAVQTVEGRDVVFVRTSQGFQARPVTVGRRSAGRAEIVSGLGAGQVVAVRNAFLLKAELGKGEGDEH